MHEMHGISSEYLDDYLSAWRDQFLGVELSWIEIEICRLAMDPKNIHDIMEEIRNKYPVASNLTKSSGYRMVESLIENEYISAIKEGRNRIIKTLPKGAKELGQLGRYLFEIQKERFNKEFWFFINDKINKYTGCLLENQVCVIGPNCKIISGLLTACQQCNSFNEFSSKKKEIVLSNMKKVYFIRIAGASLEGKKKNITVLDADEDSWPLKDNFVDVIIEIGAVASFRDKKILEEATRILKPNGWLILLEFTQSTSTFILRMMKEMIYLTAIANKEFEWKTEFNLPTIDELKDRIKKMNSYKDPVIITDSITSIILVQKFKTK